MAVKAELVLTETLPNRLHARADLLHAGFPRLARRGPVDPLGGVRDRSTSPCRYAILRSPPGLGALDFGVIAFRLVHEYVQKELAGACRARLLAGLNLFRIFPSSRNLMATELPPSAARVEPLANAALLSVHTAGFEQFRRAARLPAAPRGRRAETQAHVVDRLRKPFRVAPPKKVSRAALGLFQLHRESCMNSDYRRAQ